MPPSFLADQKSRDLTFALVLHSIQSLYRIQALRAKKIRREMIAPAALSRAPKNQPSETERNLAISLWKIYAAMGIDGVLQEASQLYQSEPHANSHCTRH